VSNGKYPPLITSSIKIKQIFLHHDNAPAHASLLIRDFLAKHETTVLPQPPYSPDLAPADFFLFQKLKSTLKGQRFHSVEEIKENSLTTLCTQPNKPLQHND
jgi:transposase